MQNSDPFQILSFDSLAKTSWLSKATHVVKK